MSGGRNSVEASIGQWQAKAIGWWPSSTCPSMSISWIAGGVLQGERLSFPAALLDKPAVAPGAEGSTASWSSQVVKESGRLDTN